MNEQKRVLLAVALCLGIAFVWQYALSKRAPKRPPAAPAPKAATQAPTADAKPEVPVAPATPGAEAGVENGSVQAAPTPVAPEKRPFVTALLKGELDNTPALTALTLLKYKEQPVKDAPDAPVSLATVNIDGKDGAQQALVTVDAANVPALRFVDGNPHALAGRNEALAVQLEVVPRSDAYALDYVLTVENVGTAAVDVGATVSMALTPLPGADEGSFLTPPADLLHGVCADTEEIYRELAKDLEGPRTIPNATWAGLDRQYFVLALTPTEPSKAECQLSAKDKVVRSDYRFLKEPVAPGGKFTRKFSLYVGPKRSQDLAAVAEPLREVIDYNIWAIPLGFLARPMVRVLELFHGISGSWGLAIIMLTLMVKLLLFPVTYKSVVSMRRMQLIKPELDKLKEKHGNDKERMQMEQLKLFREKGVNPLGGCLPMLLQMPVWLALYRSLWSDVDLYQQSFLWIDNLTAKEAFPFLAILFGGLTVLQQRLTPMATDSQQAKVMMYVMPVMFTFFMFPLPSGLVLYMVTNSVLTIIQQLVINRRQVAL